MIYLDHNATTPVHPKVLDSMLPYFSDKFANPASRTHELGREAEKVILECRTKLASIFNLETNYVIFTSGATEANNLVILGLKNHLKQIGKMKIVTSAFEHKSVLDPIKHLCEKENFEVIYIKPNRKGLIEPQEFQNAIDEKTGLVSIMHVNNELGTVQPVLKVAQHAKFSGALVHVDGAQGFCKLDLKLDKEIDYYTASAHKIYGPKGIGCLFINGRKSRKPLQPIIFGGGHEGGLRSGTLPTPLIVGFTKATEICKKLYNKKNSAKRIAEAVILANLIKKSSKLDLNTPLDTSLGTTINFRVLGCKSEALMLRLKNFALSNGSACTSKDYRPSHVLRSLGMSDSASLESIRISCMNFKFAQTLIEDIENNF